MTDTLPDKLTDKLTDILLTQKFVTLIMGYQMRTSSEYRKELPALHTVRVNRFFSFSLSVEITAFLILQLREELPAFLALLQWEIKYFAA